MDELESLDYQSQNTISNDEAAAKAEEQKKFLEYRQQQEGQRVEAANQAQTELNQKNAEIDDSRNKENWGAGEYVKEVFNAVGGGIQDTASSLITLPERVIDLATGEMARESKTKEGYKPEWDDFFVDDSNPIETKTWWGGLIRGLTHFGTLAAVPVPGFGVAGKIGATTSKIVPKLAAKPLAQTLGRGALKGAKVDLLSRYSQDDNALGILDQHFTGIGGPLATKKHDHPLVKTLKNVVEGMGLGVISDTVLEGMQLAVKKGAPKISEQFSGSRKLQEIEQGKRDLEGSQKVRAEIASIEKKLGDNPNKAALDEAKTNLDNAVEDLQIRSKGNATNKALARARLDLDMAESRYEVAYKNYSRWAPEGEDQSELVERLAELRKQVDDSAAEYSPYKNEPKEIHEGNATSVENVDDVLETQQIMKNEWGADKGSTGGLFTRTAISNIVETADMGWKEVEQYAKAIENSPKIKADISEYRRNGRTAQDYYDENLMLFDQMVRGRELTDLTTQEFMAPIYKVVGAMQEKTLKGGKVDYLDTGFVKGLDMVTGDLLRRLRDTGIMSRELEQIVDVNGRGGPTQNLVEQLIAVSKLTKMSRMIAGQDLQKLKKGGIGSKKELLEAVDKAAMEDIKALQLATKLAGEGNDELLTGIRHYISMADEVSDVDSLMAFLRTKMRGGELNGSKRTGLLIKELEMVMVNSVLSGPKTPVRAIMGTSSATFMRPMSQALGASITGNGQVFREALADANGMIQAIPESFNLFKRNLNAYWTGDLADIKTRFAERTASDENWEAMKYLIEQNGSQADKGTFFMANMARSMNDNRFLTYSTKVMAATDDAFGYILGRGRLRSKAFRDVMSELGDGNFKDVSPKAIADAENRLVDKIFDAEGNLKDEYIVNAKKEATLTQELNGFAKGLNKVFEETPWAKPFFLFAKTGVNGLNLTAKHTPGFNFLVKEWNDINFARPDKLEDVAQYGIKTAEDLANAKAIQYGRLAMGSAVIFMAGQKFLSGGLHGNGPADRTKRQMWIDSGWRPRTIKIGDAWVSYDAFEPFNQVLSIIGDIGDHQELMGEEWSQDNLQKLAVVIAQGITSKSYMAGLTQFVDLFAGQPGQLNRIAASLMNNTVPLSSLRNELGKVFTPYTRELGSDIASSIRNRNLMSEALASNELPIKYDMLTGEPIKDWDFITRMFNAVSPVSMNADYSPGREFLFNSGYDLRTSTYYAPDGTNLTDNPVLRSLFQKAIGDQRLILELDKMASDEGLQRSVALMNYNRKNGLRHTDPGDYVHNKRIAKLFDKAKKRAWATVSKDPRAKELMAEARQKEIDSVMANKESVQRLLLPTR